MQLQDKYEPLMKKYHLPSYHELDDEYELLYFQSILEISHPLRFIRRRIIDKINGFIHLFQNLLQPMNGNLIALEESSFLTEEEKQSIVYFVKNMLILERESLLLDIHHHEKKDAEFIQRAHKYWLEHKNNVSDYVTKLKEGWAKEAKPPSNAHYFG